MVAQAIWEMLICSFGKMHLKFIYDKNLISSYMNQKEQIKIKIFFSVL